MFSAIYLKVRSLAIRAYDWLTTIHSVTESSTICP